jgi:hypothetical protein
MFEKEAANLAKYAKKRKEADSPEEEVSESPEEASTETQQGQDGSNDDDMGSYDDVEGSAADELAGLAGVKDKAAFKSALSDYVQACVKKAMAS